VLKFDFKQLRSLSGKNIPAIRLFLDKGFIIVALFRFFTAWRYSVFECRQIRGCLEGLWFLFSGSMLPSGCEAGPGLVVFHGFNLVVNSKAKIGKNVTLYHGVTIGERYPGDSCPVIGDCVTIGTGACILGPVIIPSRSTVPANAVITPKSIDRIRVSKII
jgi:serine O-acetyltransferase